MVSAWQRMLGSVCVRLTWFKDPVSICCHRLAYSRFRCKSATPLHGALVTAAPLSWHHARAHNSPFKGDITSADDTVTRRTLRRSYPADTVASGDQINRHLRLKRSALRRKNCGRFLPGDSGTLKCQRDLLVLFMFAAKMATRISCRQKFFG